MKAPWSNSFVKSKPVQRGKTIIIRDTMNVEKKESMLYVTVNNAFVIEEMSERVSSGQSYKHFTLINFDSRVIPDWKIPHITNLES